MSTRIKFCGLTTLDDATAAVEAGAWALGVILWPGSARVCDRDEAQRISAAYRRRAHVCGVFVDEPLDQLTRTIDVLGLTMVQLHGSEGPAYATEIKRRTGVDVIKAIGVRERADMQKITAFRTDFHLLDARVEGLVGGTGQTWDYGLLDERLSRVPFILSGGLNPMNVAEAIERTSPFAVDVSSGVESAPGVKDHEAIELFASAVRSTDPVQPAGELAPEEETPAA